MVKVDRPDRRVRRVQGKSDPIDAYGAARAALTATRSTVPKTDDGIVEAIRAPGSGPVVARSRPPQTTNALTAPPEVRERMQDLKTQPLCRRVRGCG